MVLDHVAQGPGLVVVGATVLDPHRLRHGDLHVVDEVPVPDRLEEGVGEAQGQDVLHGLLAQVVVDAVDLALGEEPRQQAVQFPGRGQVAAERLLHHDAAGPGLPVEPGLLQSRGQDGDPGRGDGEVEQAPGPARPLLLPRGDPVRQRTVGPLVGEIPALILEEGGEGLPGLPGRRAPAGVTAHPVQQAGGEVLPAHGHPVHPDEGQLRRQQAVQVQVEERRHQLPPGEVARRPEDDQDRRFERLAHSSSLHCVR